MKIKNLFKSLNFYLDNKYNSIVSTFVGKVIVKLISEIILACLIAAAVYGATSWYNKSRSVNMDNEKLGRIYISVSDEYVENLFGIPYITVIEKDDLKNSFYVLNNAILRTVSKDNNVVAYFITATHKNRKIPIDSFDRDGGILGEIRYSDVVFANPIIDANVTGNGRYNYYSETQGTGRYGMYNSYTYGLVTYGFYTKGNLELISQAMCEGDYSHNDLQAVRNKVFPNTFGVIAEGYEEIISIIPTCDEWENIYYLLKSN
jgi:hypothetical protein